MIRLIAGAFIMAFASAAQAMPLAPAEHPDAMITQVREACGAGMHRVGGACVATPTRRSARRCAAGVTCPP
jgi:hypothetical protein